MAHSHKPATHSLSLKEVDDIAHLARMALTPEERTLYQKQLSDILTYVETLQALDTSHIEASFQVLPQTAEWRPDEVQPSMSVADALSNAPRSQDPYFHIPRILDDV